MFKKWKKFLVFAASFSMLVTNIYIPPLVQAAEHGRENLALHKTVYFSSEEGVSTNKTDTHAVNVVDGNINTCWSANGKPDGTNWDAKYPEWICVDLGKEYDIHEVDLIFEAKEGARYYGYNIYVSNEAPENGNRNVPSGFKKVVSKEGNTQSTKDSKPITEIITDAAGRYVLVEVTSCNQYNANERWQLASIYEMEVYGSERGAQPEEPDEPGTEGEIALQTASGRGSAYVKEIDGQWLFGGRGLTEADALNADRTGWTPVTIPHTWNAKDAEDGGGNYDRAIYWYHKDLEVTEEMQQKRIYIEFLGSNTQTTLYVNGQKAGDTHKGGYTAFRYDITDLVQTGTNVLDVSVDNTVDQAIAPISGDFNMYGGIYRRVYLVTVEDVHIDLGNNGSSGLALKTGNMRSMEAPADLGQFDIQADIVNDSEVSREVTIVAEIEGDNAPTPMESKISIPANSKKEFRQHCTVNNPTLWEGAHYEKNADNSNVGYQYRVTLKIKDGEEIIDQVSDKLGFRYFWIDSKDKGESGEGFYLNGKKFPLRGVNRHSFLKSVGSAMTEQQHKNDMEIIKELGVNTIRLCHYPQTDYFYDLCDENGIVVWTEIPVVNEVRASDEFKNVTKQQLTELIFQQGNRPSVCFWGLENEIGNGRSLTNAKDNKELAAAKKIMSELDALAKELDKTGRYTTQAMNRDYAMDQNDPQSVDKDFDTNVGWKSDIVAWNIYPGWYPDANFYGSFEDVMKRKTVLDSRSMGISEYGWGSNVTQHEAYPELGVNDLTAGGIWHPEEYQNLMNEEALAYINTHDELWGTYYWAMFDFAVDGRNEGSQPALNDKGLVTADRSTKKDSYYLYKANWNKKDPFVYITSRRWVERENSDTYIKVYSNCEEVSLSVNGQELGTMESKGNGVFLMEDVSLTHGDVNIQASGKNADSEQIYSDSCTWKRKSSNKADLQSGIFAVDTAAKTIAVENNVTLKEFKESVKGVNNAVYVIYDGEAEVTRESEMIVPGMRIHVTAEDQRTEADYMVISTNLCLNKQVTVSSFETGNVGENAVDGSSATRWTAVNGTYPQNIVVDLGKSYFLGNLTLDWEKKSGQRYYGYVVSVSQDGEDYIDLIDRRNNTQPGSITESLELTRARYLKITATGCNESGWATLYEIKADGYLLSSDLYEIDEGHRLIIVESIPDEGLADSIFISHIALEGNYDYKMNYSSGWIHDGNTVEIKDTNGNVAATYTICTEETKENYYQNVPVTKITLNKTSETLGVGSKLQLSASVFPVHASDKNINFSSDAPEVASVTEEGLITAQKEGEAVIKAEAANGVSASCSIKVVDYAKIKPVLSMSFDDGSKIKLHGKAALVKDPDNEQNQVLQVDDTAGGKNANYAVAENDLSSYDFSNGVTVSMKVRPTANASDWNYLFAIGKTKSHDVLNYCDGTIGFIARHTQPYEMHFPKDGWVQGNPVNSDYAFFTKEENANQWYQITYVFEKAEISVYVNGILTCKWAESNLENVLPALNQGHLVIGAGASEGELENFGGCMDDVFVYDMALNSEAVAAIGKQPQDPADPSNPGENDPSNPGENDPSNPGENDPSNPGENDPSKPGENNPSKPGENNPSKPGTTQKPGGQNSAERTKASSVNFAIKNYRYGTKTLYLVKGKTAQLKAVVLPAAAKQGVSYSSNAKTIATVSSSGKIKAKKAGTAKIAITSADGIKKTFLTVKVVKKAKENKKLSLKSKKIRLKKKNAVFQIKTKGLTAKTTSKETYKVTKGKRYIKVDAYGRITCKVNPDKKIKKAAVKVTCGKKSLTIDVTIKK